MPNRTGSRHTVVALKLLSAIAATELSIMVLFNAFHLERLMPSVVLNLADTLLLSIAASVMIYVWVVKPMKSAGEFRTIEEKLRESEIQYRSLFESSMDAIYLTRRDGPFLKVNKAALDLFGYTSEEMVGMDIRKVYADPNDRAAFQQEIEKNRFIRDYEVRFKKKDGREIDCLLTSTLITDDGGNILGYQGIIRDITGRKQMEAQLFQAKQDWEDTFNTITDMITVHDREFNIIRANRPAQQILGLPFLDISRAKCFHYYHGTGCPPEECPSCQVLKTAAPSTSELFEPHLNKFIEIRAIPRLDKNNELAGLIHVVRDITGRKKLEDQLRQAQKMEAIGQLAGGIAHDFNNILSAIIGYGYLLQMKMADSDPLRHNVEQILEASERAATLTHSLLAFSRKQQICLKLVNMNELLRRFEKLLLRLIREDIEFTTVLAAEDITVMADSGQIEQALMNLVTNARDAMPQGGKLAISTGRVMLDEEFVRLHGFGKPGEYALLTVTDTGTGMDEATKAKIFEPFFTTKEQGRGTGLGLAMVYGIVKQHDGYISVYSQPGEGTTFRVYLPSERPQAELSGQEIQAIQVPVKGGSETMLLAEDDAALRNLGSTVLSQYGYTVIEAVDGEDAVMKFMENRDRIKLIILDVIMPKKNGKEVFDDIGILNPDMKVLFMSGYTSDIIGPRGLPAEGLNFINKPISPRDLLEKVRGVLDA